LTDTRPQCRTLTLLGEMITLLTPAQLIAAIRKTDTFLTATTIQMQQ
jgi:hypothetical protein